MSTMVELQNIPASLWVNSTQSCSTEKLGSFATQPAGYCSAELPAPSVTTLNFSLSLIAKYTRPDIFGRLIVVVPVAFSFTDRSANPSAPLSDGEQGVKTPLCLT